jgi:hypothetical protein
MRCDVAQRSAAGFLGIDEPAAKSAVGKEPVVVGGLGKNRPANGSGIDKLAGARHLRIEAAVIGDAESLARLAGGLLHGLGFGIVERHRLFAKDMLARAQGLDGLRGVEEDRSGNVDRIGAGFGQSGGEILPGGDGVRCGLSGIARDDAGELTARFGENGG